MEGEVKEVVQLGAGALETLVLDPIHVSVDPVLALLFVDLLELGLGPLDSLVWGQDLDIERGSGGRVVFAESDPASQW